MVLSFFDFIRSYLNNSGCFSFRFVVYAFTVLLCSSFSVSYAQEIHIEKVDTFPDLPIDKAFPTGNDLFTFHENQIYLLHSNRRPLAMDYDSVDLFIVQQGKLHYLQNLSVPSKLQVSKLTGFGFNDSSLFFTDYNGVYIFKRNLTKYDFFRFIETVNHRTVKEGEYGSFEVWHETERGIYTTDFHRDNYTKGGCKTMFIGCIDYENLKLVDSFRIPICGNILVQINSLYPFSFEPSGNYFVAVDLPSNILSLYTIGHGGPGLKYQIDLSDSIWNPMNADSVYYWSSLMESEVPGMWDLGWMNLNRHVRASDRLEGIHFVNDSIVFLRMIVGKELKFRILNINTRLINELTFPSELREFFWYNHATRSSNGYVYVLARNKVERMNENKWVEQGKPNTLLVGYKLYKLSISYH